MTTSDFFQVLICVILPFLPGQSVSLTCLSCTDAVIPRGCGHISQCGPHEACFLDAFVTPNGFIKYNLGCRDTQFCKSSNKRTSGGTKICNTCCDSDLCNSEGCGAVGYPATSSRGPVCYTCSAHLSPDSCDTVSVCGLNMVCKVKLRSHAVTGDIYYESSCENKQLCQQDASFSSMIIGRKRFAQEILTASKSCFLKCCDDDLCSGHCGANSSDHATTAVSSLATKTYSTSSTVTTTPSTTTLTATTVPGTTAHTVTVIPSTTIPTVTAIPSTTITSASHFYLSTTTISPTSVVCADKHPNCAMYDPSICLGTYEEWSKINCRHFCNFCTTTILPTSVVCTDKNPNCAAYGQNVCTGTYEEWAKINCRHFCNLCTAALCTDQYPDYCADYGQSICTGYEAWARVNCRKYCNFCNQTAVTTAALQSSTPPSHACVYKGKAYNTGDTWQDGCDYNCTCLDASQGWQRCRSICPIWNTVPDNCTLQKIPGECCSKRVCPGDSINITNTCLYGNKYYYQGEKWRDGCKFDCECVDGSTGKYHCNALCPHWTNLPSECHISAPAAGKCCGQPSCPTYGTIPYPPGYVEPECPTPCGS